MTIRVKRLIRQDKYCKQAEGGHVTLLVKRLATMIRLGQSARGRWSGDCTRDFIGRPFPDKISSNVSMYCTPAA